METTNIYTAMAKVMDGVASVGKDKTNKLQKWKYRSIDDVYNAVHQQFAKHGIFCVTESIKVLQNDKTSVEKQDKYGNNKIQTTCHVVNEYTFSFVASDGSKINTIALGEAMDYGDKAVGKCATYAHKTALVQALVIPFDDLKDPDAEVYSALPKPSAIDTKSRYKTMVAKFNELGVPESEFLSMINKKIGDELTNDHFSQLATMFVNLKNEGVK